MHKYERTYSDYKDPQAWMDEALSWTIAAVIVGTFFYIITR